MPAPCVPFDSDYAALTRLEPLDEGQQVGQLTLTTDELGLARYRPLHRHPHTDQAPDRHRYCLSLQLDPAVLLDVDQIGDELVGVRTDENLASAGQILESGGDVHGVTNESRHSTEEGGRRCHDYPGLDPAVHSNRPTDTALDPRTHGVDGVVKLVHRPHGSDRVILV